MDNIQIIRESRSSIVLKILKDGSVIVKAPHLIPSAIIKNFINKNAERIEKNRKRILAAAPVRKRYLSGEKFLFLGKEYAFTIGNYPRVTLEEDKLLFPKALLFRAEKEIENWYIRQAKETISRLVEEYARMMSTSYSELRFSDTSSKWGSCSRDNRLQFNWKLIMAPLIVVRYVIIHELVHTSDKNHSRAFWIKVASQNPSYKQQIKWLKDHGNNLIT